MPTVDAVVSCPVHDSFRVQQVAGLFDVPLAARATERFTLDVPDLQSDPNWQIGLVTGPSGSGKSTIARALFGADSICSAEPWPADRAVIDGMGEQPIRELTSLLVSVGLGSPPAWIKPYTVLSGGERFRCDLARALARATSGAPHLSREHSGANEPAVVADESPEFGAADDEAAAAAEPLVVFDEFTSVVDRQVAQIGSAAVARAIRRGAIRARFVAVTCHADVEAWLEPDWVIDMTDAAFHRRRLRRPPIEVEIRRCGRGAWAAFARHHYLSASLPAVVRCYLATWRGLPVTFCAVAPLAGRRGRWRISRIVTLPDFQGVGIGMRVLEAVAGLYRSAGLRLNVTASHPGLLAHCVRSSDWVAVNQQKIGTRRHAIRDYRGSRGRAVVSFEYIGDCGASQCADAPRAAIATRAEAAQHQGAP